MEDARTLMKKAIEENLSNEELEISNKLVEAACTAIDRGGSSDQIRDVIAAEVSNILDEAESTLSDTERIIKGEA